MYSLPWDSHWSQSMSLIGDWLHWWRKGLSLAVSHLSGQTSSSEAVYLYISVGELLLAFKQYHLCLDLANWSFLFSSLLYFSEYKQLWQLFFSYLFEREDMLAHLHFLHYNLPAHFSPLFQLNHKPLDSIWPMVAIFKYRNGKYHNCNFTIIMSHALERGHCLRDMFQQWEGRKTLKTCFVLKC